MSSLTRPSPAASTPPLTEPAPLRSVHSTSFPELLKQLGLSVLVTTYQAGKLVMLRADGTVLNTHFRGFDTPMGLAIQNGRLAIGTKAAIREYHDVPAVTAHLEPAGKHDACFLPRMTHHTGNVAIHEMAWGGPLREGSPARDVGVEGEEPELWFVNTRFSCLCTRDPAYSFVPRWRPPFVTALAAEDRCHLNGLAIVDGLPRFVTALAATDTPQGWRDHKRDGGVLLDVATGETLCRGLSMPHSPRWHDGKLWVLNSGAGGLGFLEPGTGRYQEVARLPGFTRGLEFRGRFAFVGLSQVRESAVFSGIAVAELPLAERCCGVWVVDVVTGQTVALVKFEDAVQEVFAVALLPGRRFPDLLEDSNALLETSYVVPDEALKDLPERSAHARTSAPAEERTGLGASPAVLSL